MLLVRYLDIYKIYLSFVRGYGIVYVFESYVRSALPYTNYLFGHLLIFVL